MWTCAWLLTRRLVCLWQCLNVWTDGVDMCVAADTEAGVLVAVFECMD